MRKPDAEGIAGRAWRIEFNVYVDEAHQAGIQSWLVNVPKAHPVWHWWAVSVIHLRDIPGVPPAAKQYPKAEYEFMIFSIDPERCPNPDPDDAGKGFPILTPIDVIVQFHGVTDKQAAAICEDAAGAIVNGHLSPDHDFRRMWKFAIDATVKHYAEGVHG